MAVAGEGHGVDADLMTIEDKQLFARGRLPEAYLVVSGRGQRACIRHEPGRRTRASKRPLAATEGLTVGREFGFWGISVARAYDRAVLIQKDAGGTLVAARVLKTNAQVGRFFQSLFNEYHDDPDVQVLATALNVYAMTASLGGAQGQSYGFTITAEGLGASSFNVRADGAASGVANDTILNVYELLKAANDRAVGGVLYAGDADLRGLAEDLFERLNRARD